MLAASSHVNFWMNKHGGNSEVNGIDFDMGPVMTEVVDPSSGNMRFMVFASLEVSLQERAVEPMRDNDAVDQDDDEEGRGVAL
jgi:hypothetical protein